MKIKIRSVIRTAILVVLAALVGVSVYVVNAERLNGNALPMPLGFGVTVVLSGSMEPELSVGDLLIVVNSDTYGVDDVVVFQSGRTGIVHRIISIDGDTVITQGDANNVADSPISVSQIKGVVTLSVPYLGYVVEVIKTPVGTVILLALAFLLLEISFKRDKRSNDREIDAIRAEIERLKSTNK